MMTPGDLRVTGEAAGGCCCQTGLTPAVKTGRRQSRSLGAHSLLCQSWDRTWNGDPVACPPSGPLETLCLPLEGRGG